VVSDAGVWFYVGVGAYLAAVSENCVSNLLREGITGEEVRLVGDTMYESIIRHVKDVEVEKAARGYWLIWVSPGLGDYPLYSRVYLDQLIFFYWSPYVFQLVLLLLSIARAGPVPLHLRGRGAALWGILCLVVRMWRLRGLY